MKWDVSIVLNIVQCKSKQLPHLLHDLKDNYICDNKEILNLLHDLKDNYIYFMI